MSLHSPMLTVSRRRSLRLNQSPNNSSILESDAKENHTPDAHRKLDLGHKKNLANIRTPLTPVHNSLVHNLRQKLEQQLSEKFENSDIVVPSSETRTSPGLVKLRTTPGRKLREKQEILLQKHEEARSRAANTCVGGGISIWPEMENMRLTSKQTTNLVASCVTLIGSVIYLFSVLHGSLMADLGNYLQQLKAFSKRYPLDKHGTHESFNSSLLNWHTAFTSLLEEVSSRVEVSLPSASLGYKLYLLLYVAGIGTLLYYLADNVMSTNKLTPRRIKIWVCLLVVMGTWTLLMLQLLVLAQAIEGSVETNVHWLNSQLADLVYMNYDLMIYRDLRTYWQTRCLPPTTQGTLSLLGVVALRDISYYLQYYSLPVLTALLMPVGKLILALKQVYTVKPHA